MGSSAFIVKVPEAEGCVRELRLLYDPSARAGVPAHITVLFPFMDATLISSDVLQRASGALRTVPSFRFGLTGVGQFPNVAYLVPEPATPFITLTRALAAAFPHYPPYGGQHSGTVPHLSVATRDQESADRAAQALAVWLEVNGPIHCACGSISLLENSTGCWREMRAFSLPGR